MNNRIKLLQVADSGGGKTSALASLANSGFFVKILDFDNNTRVIRKFLNEPSLWDSHISIVSFNLMEDIADGIGKKSAMPGKLMKILGDKWVDNEGKDHGKLSSLDENHVIVLDTTTFMGQGLMRDALWRFRSPSITKGYDPDNVGSFDRSVYSLAQNKFATVVKYLCQDPSIRANIVFNAHMKYTEEEGTGITKCYPDTGCGTALSPSLGKSFTDIWRIDTKNDGTKSYRIEGDTRMSLKNSFPFKTDTSYKFDLGEAFNALLGRQ